MPSEAKLSDTVAISPSALDELYSGTERITRDEVVIWHFGMLAARYQKPEVGLGGGSAYGLHCFLSHLVANGQIETFQTKFTYEDKEHPTASLEALFGRFEKFPWLGELAMASLPLEVRYFECQVDNHMFDDNPLPFGISRLEAHVIRAYMHNDTDNFRKDVASLVPKPGLTV